MFLWKFQIKLKAFLSGSEGSARLTNTGNLNEEMCDWFNLKEDKPMGMKFLTTLLVETIIIG